MFTKNSFLTVVLVVATFFTLSFPADSKTAIRCGYFVAGQQPVNDQLREEFTRQLQAVAPDSIEFIFIPEGYGEGDWKRDSCKTLATYLTTLSNIDLMVTIGPWVVKDLLIAGYKGPILAMRMLDPQASGLVDKRGRPTADNLTVHINPNKIEDDITMFMRLVPIKKLGVLFFPSDSLEHDAVMSRIDSLGRRYGFDVFTAEGYNNYGTYAFFKAADKLGKKVDAIYLGPLWGMDVVKIKAFLKRFVDAKIPVFTYEGKYLVERGAFATNADYSIISEARYNALKAVKIVNGEQPADLDVFFRSGTALAINQTTAQRCGIDLPADILVDADVTEAPISADKVSYYRLIDVITRSLSANPGFLATYDAMQQAEQAAQQAKGTYLPQLGLTARAGYVDDNTVTNTNEPIDNTQYRASLVLQQPLFSLEKIKSITIAGKKKDLQEINQLQAKLDLELAVATVYIEYLKAEKLLAIEHRYRQVVERNLELSAACYYLEDKNLADFVRWQDERYKVISQVEAAKSRVEIARSAMNSLLNMPPDNLFLLDSGLISEEDFFTDINILRPIINSKTRRNDFQYFLASVTGSDNPDLRAYNLELVIQQARLGKNKARFIPSLNVKAAFNLADELADQPGVFEEQHDTWSVFGELRLPLFLGGDRFHERSKLKAKLSELEFQRDAVSLELTGKIQKEMSTLTMLSHTVPRILRSQELAIQNLGLVTVEYDARRVSIADMLEAYRHARETEIKAVVDRGRFYLTMAGLVHTLGLSGQGTPHIFRDQFRRQVAEFMKQ